MATKPLQSITFPGIDNVYTVPQVDNTNTQAGAAAEAKKTGDDIDALEEDITELKDNLSDGTMTVNKAENADQLTATVGIEDNTPYLFRTSGGSVDIGDREDVRKIVGGTVVWNQQNKITSMSWTTYQGVTFTKISDTTIKVSGECTANANARIYYTPTIFPPNHVYLIDGFPSNISVRIGNASDKVSPTLCKPTVSTESTVIGYITAGTDFGTGVEMTPQVFDITLMFGSTIADYIYSLETATVGAGVAWLKKHFPAQFDAGYQAYDAGSLQSVSGLTAHKMVGFNQWDEEWELGNYSTTSGNKTESSIQIRCKNPIPIIPDTLYYAKNTDWLGFRDADGNIIPTPDVGIEDVVRANNMVLVGNRTFTTPSNAHSMFFYQINTYGTTYKNDICINLHWDGERDGEYEPYVEYTYALDDSVMLRGIPKLDTNNQLYYDGDEYLPDGTVNRRYGIVDLGTLNWSYESDYSRFNPANGSIPNVKIPVSTDVPNAIVPLFRAVTSTVGWASRGGNENLFCIDETGYLRFYTTQYSSAESFKTAMSGVLLVYELATPTTETADPYQETQIVDDFGTEEFILADGAFPVPVGHETYYKSNLRAKLEMAPDSPDGDGLYVVQQESGQNEYVPLASTSTIQDILTRLTALENA